MCFINITYETIYFVWLLELLVVLFLFILNLPFYYFIRYDGLIKQMISWLIAWCPGREYLDYEFQELKHLDFYNLENIIDDWVLMGFLVGNDFIPHLPNLHINKGHHIHMEFGDLFDNMLSFNFPPFLSVFFFLLFSYLFPLISFSCVISSPPAPH